VVLSSGIAPGILGLAHGSISTLQNGIALALTMNEPCHTYAGSAMVNHQTASAHSET